MKKTILFGVVAMFAIGAMSIQTAEAQNPVKKSTTEKVTVKPEKQDAEKAPATAVSVEKKDAKDCCANKKVSAEKKEAKDCCSEKKCASEKMVKAEGKKDGKSKALKQKKEKQDKRVKKMDKAKVVSE